jgi:hypothetical protein
MTVLRRMESSFSPAPPADAVGETSAASASVPGVLVLMLPVLLLRSRATPRDEEEEGGEMWLRWPRKPPPPPPLPLP